MPNKVVIVQGHCNDKNKTYIKNLVLVKFQIHLKIFFFDGVSRFLVLTSFYVLLYESTRIGFNQTKKKLKTRCVKKMKTERFTRILKCRFFLSGVELTC